jgi:hypothetical protein
VRKRRRGGLPLAAEQRRQRESAEALADVAEKPTTRGKGEFADACRLHGMTLNRHR